jgi:hypothetical protein
MKFGEKLDFFVVALFIIIGAGAGVYMSTLEDEVTGKSDKQKAIDQMNCDECQMTFCSSYDSINRNENYETSSNPLAKIQFASCVPLKDSSGNDITTPLDDDDKLECMKNDCKTLGELKKCQCVGDCAKCGNESEMYIPICNMSNISGNLETDINNEIEACNSITLSSYDDFKKLINS